MTKRERVLAAVERRAVDRPPVAFWRHVPEVDHTSQGLADAMLAFHHTWDLDLVKVMSSGVYCVGVPSSTPSVRRRCNSALRWHLVCCLSSREDSMKSVAGIFTSRDAAERAVQRLASLGISRDHLTLLTPGADGRRLAAMPIDEGEAPGTGAAIGAVTGMATGAGVGLPIGAAVSLAVPGIGPIIAFGLLGAALFGAGGAAIGNALETTLTQGVPRDDVFVIEDALRGGQSVVIALVEDEATAMRVRDALREGGALDFETARDRWWSALPEAERGRFEPVEEHAYRCGFEAAQWCDNRENVRPLHGPLIDEPAFQRGFERGQDYRARALRKSA